MMEKMQRVADVVMVLFLCGMLAFVLVQWFTGSPS